jgi:tRNA-specific 2-thiouridylase
MRLSQYKGKRVAVAMSGGVDSSVAALLLKKAGADVFGVTMQIVPWSRCCLPEDVAMAKFIAKKLGIPHYTINLMDEFKKTAIDYFVRESRCGRTPNPCVPCNQKIKFGLLLKAAEKRGAEYFATGHYARLKLRHGRPVLLRPKDITKDQSYVLSMLPKNIFKKLIFPIGDYTKERVRKIARDNNIPVHSKPSNQDLCFLNKEKGDFIEWWTQKKLKPGNIVDASGAVLAKHKGLVHYTIGQRRGLGINNQTKYYVKGIDPRKNQVIVANYEALNHKQFYVSGLNWVSIDAPTTPIDAEVLVRNKAVPQKAKLVPKGKRVLVIPKKPIWAVSPGQIAVFIKKDVVLGGGWIT